MATLGVFAMVFDDQRRLLCVRMNYATKNWTTPGGRVEPGESPLVALQREALEETGYSIEVGPLIGVYAKPFKDDVVFSFEARSLSRSFWEPNEEISEVKWFASEEIPSAMSVVVSTRVQDALQGKRGVFRVFPNPSESHAT